jgi:hypothetical protein
MLQINTLHLYSIMNHKTINNKDNNQSLVLIFVNKTHMPILLDIVVTKR